MTLSAQLDKITEAQHLDPDELEDRWGREFCAAHSFELFDKAVALSLSSNEDGKEDGMANAVFRDFVQYLSGQVRAREMYMMAVDKLSSLNIATADDHTLALLLYSLQLGVKELPQDQQSSALALVLSACCSRSARARQEAEGEGEL
jgi:hypothetical protein